MEISGNGLVKASIFENNDEKSDSSDDGEFEVSSFLFTSLILICYVTQTRYWSTCTQVRM